jgi:hypothetical protein
MRQAFSSPRTLPLAEQRKEPAHASLIASAPAVGHPSGVYGIYSDRREVEPAIEKLKELGFPNNEVSVPILCEYSGLRIFQPGAALPVGGIRRELVLADDAFPIHFAHTLRQCLRAASTYSMYFSCTAAYHD